MQNLKSPDQNLELSSLLKIKPMQKDQQTCDMGEHGRPNQELSSCILDKLYDPWKIY